MNALLNSEVSCPDCGKVMLLIKQNGIPAWYEHDRWSCEYDNTRWQVPTVTLTQMIP